MMNALEKLKNLRGRIQERRWQFLVMVMVVFASFGNVHAIDNNSTLYPLYTLIVDFADIVPAIVTLVMGLVVLIFVFVIIGFMTGLFDSILGNMRVGGRRGR